LKLINSISSTGYDTENPGSSKPKQRKEEAVTDARMIEKFDEAMEAAWDKGTDEDFGRLLGLLEGRHVDHRHTYTQATALMIAAAKNKLDIAVQLLSRGADPAAVACNDFTALEWAVEGGHEEMATVVRQHLDTGIVNATQDQERLDAYQQEAGIADENIDSKLIGTLVAHLAANCPPGAILIFLPGYEDIIDVSEKVNEAMGMVGVPFRVFMLHSNMQVCSIDLNKNALCH